jgi:hypothetical protein
VAYWLTAVVGCARSTGWVSLPAQWPDFSGVERRPFGALVRMNDPRARAYLVRDIADGLGSDELRWAFRNPQLRFWLDRTDGQVLTWDFRMHSVTLASTGPVTITVSINGRALDQIRCGRDGDYHFEKRVPAEWLYTDRPTLVALTPDRVWVSPQDGGVLSFLLRQVGFRRQ